MGDMPARHVRIIFRMPGQKQNREVIGDLMEETRKGYMLSLRPEAGTTMIDYEWVSLIADTTLPTHLPRRLP